MSRFSNVVISVLLALILAGCFIRPRNLPVAPVPLTTLTPDGSLNGGTITPPWIQTATQAPGGDPGAGAATPNPLPTLQDGATSSTPGSTDPTLAPTAISSVVRAILVKDVVRLRRGPGSGYDVLGLAQSGEKLEVLGKSTDGTWWQVRCEQGPNNTCWVSADSSLTEPTAP
jgi:hypothetical protein